MEHEFKGDTPREWIVWCWKYRRTYLYRHYLTYDIASAIPRVTEGYQQALGLSSGDYLDEYVANYCWNTLNDRNRGWDAERAKLCGKVLGDYHRWQGENVYPE